MNFLKKISRKKCLTLFLYVCSSVIILILYEHIHLNFIDKRLKEADSRVQVVHLGKQNGAKSFITVVTALFLFNKSKHSNSSYDNWSHTMIKSIGVPMVAFVDNKTAPIFIQRCISNNITGLSRLF